MKCSTSLGLLLAGGLAAAAAAGCWVWSALSVESAAVDVGSLGADFGVETKENDSATRRELVRPDDVPTSTDSREAQEPSAPVVDARRAVAPDDFERKYATATADDLEWARRRLQDDLSKRTGKFLEDEAEAGRYEVVEMKKGEPFTPARNHTESVRVESTPDAPAGMDRFKMTRCEPEAVSGAEPVVAEIRWLGDRIVALGGGKSK